MDIGAQEHRLILAINALAEAIDRSTAQLQTLNDRANAQPTSPEEIAQLANEVMKGTGIQGILEQMSQPKVTGGVIEKPAVVVESHNAA